MVTKEKIKLCFLSLKAYPLFNTGIKDLINKGVFGGAEIDMYNLAVWFSKQGDFEIKFWVADYGQEDEEIYDNILVKKLKYITPNTTDMGVTKKISRKVLLYKELFFCDSDIYITEAASKYVGLLAIIEKIIKRKKFIFRLASDVDANVEFYKDEKRTYYLYKFGIRNCSLVISQSENQKNLLINNLNLKSVVIKNGFFIDDNIPMDIKSFILWVSRGVPLKRPEVFLELAKKLPDKQFVIIMPGNHPIVSKIKEAASKLDNVAFIDYVPYFEIHRYYEGALLFVNTSEYEGFPNAFIQACLGKTPILSFRVDPDDFIKKNSLGYCCNDNMEAAADFIRNLDEKSMEFYGNNAFEYVKKNHNIEDIGRKIADAIGNL